MKKKYTIAKQIKNIAEITISLCCIKGDPKIDSLIKDLTFAEIQKVGNLQNTEKIESENYIFALKDKDIFGYHFILAKKETVIL